MMTYNLNSIDNIGRIESILSREFGSIAGIVEHIDKINDLVDEISKANFKLLDNDEVSDVDIKLACYSYFMQLQNNGVSLPNNVINVISKSPFLFSKGVTPFHKFSTSVGSISSFVGRNAMKILSKSRIFEINFYDLKNKQVYLGVKKTDLVTATLLTMRQFCSLKLFAFSIENSTVRISTSSNPKTIRKAFIRINHFLEPMGLRFMLKGDVADISQITQQVQDRINYKDIKTAMQYAPKSVSTVIKELMKGGLSEFLSLYNTYTKSRLFDACIAIEAAISAVARVNMYKKNAKLCEEKLGIILADTLPYSVLLALLIDAYQSVCDNIYITEFGFTSYTTEDHLVPMMSSIDYDTLEELYGSHGDFASCSICFQSASDKLSKLRLQNIVSEILLRFSKHVNSCCITTIYSSDVFHIDVSIRQDLFETFLQFLDSDIYGESFESNRAFKYDPVLLDGLNLNETYSSFVVKDNTVLLSDRFNAEDKHHGSNILELKFG